MSARLAASFEELTHTNMVAADSEFAAFLQPYDLGVVSGEKYVLNNPGKAVVDYAAKRICQCVLRTVIPQMTPEEFDSKYHDYIRILDQNASTNLIRPLSDNMFWACFRLAIDRYALEPKSPVVSGHQINGHNNVLITGNASPVTVNLGETIATPGTLWEETQPTPKRKGEDAGVNGGTDASEESKHARRIKEIQNTYRTAEDAVKGLIKVPWQEAMSLVAGIIQEFINGDERRRPTTDEVKREVESRGKKWKNKVQRYCSDGRRNLMDIAEAFPKARKSILRRVEAFEWQKVNNDPQRRKRYTLDDNRDS